MVSTRSSRGVQNKAVTPTVDQLASDKISQLAGKYWSPNVKNDIFDPKVIEEIYANEIVGSHYSVRRIMVLEFSQYLENYLWKYYDSDSSLNHTLSIVIMVNEKFRERVPAWEALVNKPHYFPDLFHQVLVLMRSSNKTNLVERSALLVFLNHCFNSMEVDLIREEVQRLVCLPIWMCLIDARREAELLRIPKWKKYWKVIQKKESKDNDTVKAKKKFERTFLCHIITEFCDMLSLIENEDPVDPDKLKYCVRFLELMIDLESSLPTRRFFNTLLHDSHLIVHCQESKLLKIEEGKLFAQLFEMLKFYSRFEINDETGDPLSDKEMTRLHYDKITSLQRAAFLKFPELRDFSMGNVASVDTRLGLAKHFKSLSPDKLYEVAEYLHLLPNRANGEDKVPDKEFLMELLISEHERRQSQLELLNEMPLYPTDDVIWNENVVPTEYYSGEGCLALPKLNLQFLTLHDYLLRNFNLFRLESTYEIRQDIEDSVRRLKPWVTEDGNTIFGGWARMAQPITQFTIVEVAKPNIGEKQPSRVRADVKVNLNVRDNIKEEWENLRKHDVCFLISVRPVAKIGTSYHFSEPFVPQVGLTYVRGCEIEGLLDESGRVIEDGPEPKPKLKGDTRVWRVWLDSNQYRLDMEKVGNGEEDVYETFNILMRRKPKENNFKAVLETIRDLMNAECVVPDWLHDIILGYGDPGSAHYSKLPNPIATLDFNDTFLDIDHLQSSFPGYQFDFGNKDPRQLTPPYKLTFKSGTDNSKVIFVEPHVIPNRGPYPFNEPRKNTIKFTPTQVEAIRSGMQPGLTMVVGPPGTGKTDVAVQIISNIYHNFPEQRTLIVTHSNQALNQLFEKIMMLDIDERHLLRLGHGEEALETEKDFSRYGRVNYVLTKRLELLNEVQRLQESLGVQGDVAYTCETASYFFLHHILSRWEKFLSVTSLDHNEKVPIDSVQTEFPFHKFFENAPQPVFQGRSYEEDMFIAEGCFRYIKKIFTQLEEFQAFEMLRSGLDRSRYLLVKEAKIIAMTCTHAALKRKELVELGFEYDNILMEESAQILEIETFIPMLLQTPLDGHNRLKRWIMIGDHHQLPPVIKNMAFQKYSNMEQSLFTRFVRLTVPTVDLDGQGRARPSICCLYNWRYKNLGDLKHVVDWPEYNLANPGFCYDYQLINVNDFNGIGESEPTPYFYQNLAEAEYVVAVYMYMRLLGYPAEKISILTTYNGQKHLLRDVVNARCANNPLIGKPYKVTTVDKYQGQQNDYILLSLVKTKAVGHLRDVRRLVVAMSRARLGLYVFARVSLFHNCHELAPTFKILKERPLELHLCPNESFPTERFSKDLPPGPPLIIKDMPEMASFVYELYQKKLEVIQDLYSKQKWVEVGTVPITADSHEEPIHPGAGSDSDEEEDEAKPSQDEEMDEKEEEDIREIVADSNEVTNDIEMEESTNGQTKNIDND